MSKDREYIKDLFDSDGIKAPESLSEENMLAMLESAENTAPKESKVIEAAAPVKRFEKKRVSAGTVAKRLIAAAAVLLVAVMGISGLAEMLTAPPDTAVSGSELYVFNNEREITSLLKDLDSSHVYKNFNYGGDVVEDGMIEYESSEADSYAPAAGESLKSSAVTGAETAGHSETYLQVDDVDEADIVKTDGKYIYYVNTAREVVILSAEDGKTKRLSTIGSSGVENYIDDIYLSGDRLITVGRFYKGNSDEENTGIVVYDISDRSKPEAVYDFSQTGSILSSRMVGDYVYLVTSDYVSRGGRAVPMCGSGSLKSLDAHDISCVPEPSTSSYIVLSAVDVSEGSKGRTTTRAVLGASEEIYCNDHALYVIAGEYDNDSSTYFTRIARASLDGAKVRFDATARVRGYVDSQFSMDEKDGYFRIATTSERAGMDVNNLFVLDPELNEAGSVTGFARNESIRAVRYIGDKAYVITYEAIDPLFVIDLSDPADPRIEGEVKIDGFSTLLIPVSKDRLLGIGHATGDNGYGGEYDSGLKLALFDISDPSQPKVLDSKEFEYMTSFAQSDHHALTVNSEAGYYAIPYEIWRYEDDWGDDVIIEDAEEPTEVIDPEDDPDEFPVDGPGETHEAGMLVFGADDKIGPVDQHELDLSQVFRGVYIGDWIYALDADGEVRSFRPSL